MAEWTFLTPHARALLIMAENPETRLRDVAIALDVTERTAYAIVDDLARAGYVVKEREGRRNRYHIQDHLPMHDPISRTRTVGQLLELLTEAWPKSRHTRPRRPRSKPAGPTIFDGF